MRSRFADGETEPREGGAYTIRMYERCRSFLAAQWLSFPLCKPDLGAVCSLLRIGGARAHKALSTAGAAGAGLAADREHPGSDRLAARSGRIRASGLD